jgi:co-chaperonin GroES (HSP10)
MTEGKLSAEDLDQLLPKPTGYKLLVALPKPDEKTEGGIIKASNTLHNEQVASVVGQVIDMGPDAYSGETIHGEQRFPNGPYCEVGDWIMMRAYSGTRFRVHGTEFRLLNDDSVEAVVADPKGIEKI